MAVNTLVIVEVFYLFNTRYVAAPARTGDGLLGDRYILIAVVLVISFQLLFTYVPLCQPRPGYARQRAQTHVL